MDLAILYFFNVTMATPILDIFFVNICDFDIWRWPLALVGIALLWKGGPGGRRVVASAVIAALIIDPSVYRLLKPLFGRLRPCHEPLLDWIRAIDGCGGRYGFPSSHAANAFGVTVVFSAFYRTAKYYFIPLAILISAGRVYLGVHYPSDVAAGAVFGVGVAIGVIYLLTRFRRFNLQRYFYWNKGTGP
jgi:undecaprenyl-diphosphatase